MQAERVITIKHAITAFSVIAALLPGIAASAQDDAKPTPPIPIVVFDSSASYGDDIPRIVVQTRDDLRDDKRFEVLLFSPDSPTFVVGAKSANPPLSINDIESSSDELSLTNAVEAQYYLVVTPTGNNKKVSITIVSAATGAQESISGPEKPADAANDTARLIEGWSAAHTGVTTGVSPSAMTSPLALSDGPSIATTSPTLEASSTSAESDADATPELPQTQVSPVVVHTPPVEAVAPVPVSVQPQNAPASAVTTTPALPSIQQASVPPAPTSTVSVAPPSLPNPAVEVSPTPLLVSPPSPTVPVTLSPSPTMSPNRAVAVTQTRAPESHSSPAATVTPVPAPSPSPIIAVTPAPSLASPPNPTVAVTLAPAPTAPPTPILGVTPAPLQSSPPIPAVAVTPAPSLTAVPSPTVEVRPEPAPSLPIVGWPSTPSTNISPVIDTSPSIEISSVSVGSSPSDVTNTLPLIAPASQPAPVLGTVISNAAQSYIDQGDAALQTSDNFTAIADYQKAVSLSPRAASPRLKLANAYLEAGMKDQASDEAQRALAIDPGNTDVQSFIRDQVSGQDGPSGDVMIAQAQTESDPNNPASWISLGDAYWNISDPDDSLISYKHAADIDPNAVIPQTRLAKLYAARAQYDLSLAALDRSGPAGYPYALRIISSQSVGIIGDLDDDVDQLNKGQYTREQFSDKVIASDQQAENLADFVAKITPPEAYKVSHLHRELSTRLIAQIASIWLDYAETNNSSDKDNAAGMEKHALDEITTASIAEDLQSRVKP